MIVLKQSLDSMTMLVNRDKISQEFISKIETNQEGKI